MEIYKFIGTSQEWNWQFVEQLNQFDKGLYKTVEYDSKIQIFTNDENGELGNVLETTYVVGNLPLYPHFMDDLQIIIDDYLSKRRDDTINNVLN
jgi:hypothetical protein